MKTAQAYIAQLDAGPCVQAADRHPDRPGPAFYPAEDYHQDFADPHPRSPTSSSTTCPKVGHLKTMFPDVYRETPVLVAQAAKGN